VVLISYIFSFQENDHAHLSKQLGASFAHTKLFEKLVEVCPDEYDSLLIGDLVDDSHRCPQMT
jgi:hypothetical protein